jgi:hypothetical protein
MQWNEPILQVGNKLKRTDAMASWRLGLGFLLPDDPNMRFIAKEKKEKGRDQTRKQRTR